MSLTSADYAIKFEQVSYHYETESGSLPILEKIQFEVGRSEFVSLVGPSGSGKSTIFHLISGLLEPISGQIRLNTHEGHRAGRGGGSGSGRKSSGKRLGQVGYMPQKDLLMPWRTVVENAALALEIKGISKSEARQIVASHLPQFGLESFGDSHPAQLSGGMRQRVSFMRTVLGGSDILLLDEPFSALDALTRASMQKWLLKLWENMRQTVLFITHDVEEALLLSDRVLLLSGTKRAQALTSLHVPFPRPRSYKSITDPRFTQMRAQLLDAMEHASWQGEQAGQLAEQQGDQLK